MNDKNLPLSIAMEEAKRAFAQAISDVMQKYSLPAFIAEPLISNLLNDLQNQKAREIATDYDAIKKQEEKKGVEDNAAEES